MLQRIQSIWLLLASGCAVLSLKFPFYSGTNKEGIPSYDLLPDNNHFTLMLVTIIIALISMISIFLYKNRSTQIRFVILAMLLEVALLILYFRVVSTFLSGTYALSSLLQAAVLVFLFLAIRGINHDNKIIKESNRLR